MPPGSSEPASEATRGSCASRFPGYRGKHSLEEISWGEFAEKFKGSALAFVYQEHTASGNLSRFSRLVAKEHAKARLAKTARAKKATTRRAKPRTPS